MPEKPSDDPPIPLPYRTPNVAVSPITAREIFRIVRWGCYASLFGAITGLLFYEMYSHYRMQSEGGLSVIVLLAVFCILTGILSIAALSMVRQTWRECLRQHA